MKTSIIVQARMTSTRLPGKVLLEVSNKPLLAYVIERLRMVPLADNLIIATTTNASDDGIVELCEKMGCMYFRGSEDNVLERYHGSALSLESDVIVRITSDCPLIDPMVVNEVIDHFLTNRAEFDYVSNTLTRTYPRGLDCEVFSRKVLQEAHDEATEQSEREHVTPFIYTRPNRFRLGTVTLPQDYSHHRWTVDTPADFELIRIMLEELYGRKPDFGLKDCLDLLVEHPEWEKINSHIEQKAL